MWIKLGDRSKLKFQLSYVMIKILLKFLKETGNLSSLDLFQCTLIQKY